MTTAGPFAAGMAALPAELDTYLDRPGADPAADSVGHRQGTVWLSPDELAEMISDLRAVLRSRWSNEPAPRRAPHLVSAIFFPSAEPLATRDRHTGPAGSVD